MEPLINCISMSSSECNYLEIALRRLEQALTILETTLEHRTQQRKSAVSYEELLARVNEDRSRLAYELDQRIAYNEKLLEVGQEVSRRLINIQEAIYEIINNDDRVEE